MNLKLGIVGWPLTKTYSPLIHKLLGEFLGINIESVSYTHLTLPTICSV